MFFSYIIQFLIVLFIYLGLPGANPPQEPILHLALLAVGLAAYGLLCRRTMSRVRGRNALVRLESRLGWLAVGFFGVDVYLLELPGLVRLIPGTGQMTFLNGLFGLGFYFLYLLLLWSGSLAGLRNNGEPELRRSDHFQSQLRLTLPLLMPWFIMALLYDLLGLLAPPWLTRWTGTGLGELALIAVVMAGLTVLMPPLVTKAWGCRPLPKGPVRDLAEGFLNDQGVRVREILEWPLFGGRLLTAGVMGLIPSLRYLLIAPGLIQGVSQEELLGVLAHEAGHLKHRHLYLYLLFFLGYVFLAYALGGLSLTWLLGFEPVAGLLVDNPGQSGGIWFSVLISAPMLLLMVVYFRFIFAYFMRNFERQADAFAARKVGPGPVREALLTIALKSGIDPQAPSWHHFSIAQRVEFLSRMERDPDLPRRHGQMLKKALLGYLASMAVLAALLLPTGLFQGPEELNLELALGGLNKAIQEQPLDPRLRLYRGMTLIRLERFAEAARAYEEALSMTPEEPAALNDLAWLLATGPDEVRDPRRALALARRAARLKPEPAVLDTLAEACYVNGLFEEAVRWSRAALALDPDDRAFFQRQTERFEKALKERREG